MCSSIVSYIILTAWTNDSIPEPPKRAVVIALLNVAATIGDIVSAYVLNKPPCTLR